jgi:hypothetical protein
MTDVNMSKKTQIPFLLYFSMNNSIPKCFIYLWVKLEWIWEIVLKISVKNFVQRMFLVQVSCKREKGREASLSSPCFDIKWMRYVGSFHLIGVHNRPGVAQRVPGGSGSQISMTFSTWRWWVQPHAPATFTPRRCSWYSFSLGAESTPGPWYDRREICHWKIHWHHWESIPGPSD